MIFEEKHFFCQHKLKQIFFPQIIHRTSEPIRDLVDFPTNIDRTREPIRDLVDSRDSEKVLFQRFGNF